MKLKLLPEGDSILKQMAEPWDFEKDGSPEELVKELSKLMIVHNAIGLAAPQVGVLKRVFVMGNPDFLIACVNPEIIESMGEKVGNEGCLSFPDLWLKVKRGDIIRVKYQTVQGTEEQRELRDLMARVFQHERDHLDGVTFDTKVAKLSLQLAKEKRVKRKR